MNFLRLDGAEEVIQEPLWQLSTKLLPVEKALLLLPPLRRLHHLAMSGSSSLLTGYTQSRLQHTLGVFALVAYFEPDNIPLRVAALLHDMGHYPFSHTLEQLAGIDHHALTLTRLHAAPVAPLLQAYDLDPKMILRYIMGEKPSLLRNTDNTMHADHLDAWVRGAFVRGQLGSGAALLSALKMVDDHLETDLATAKYIVELAVAEAQLHASATNLGSSAVIAQLVTRLLDARVTSREALAEMTDAELSCLLLISALTSTETRKLWFGPETLALSRGDTKGITVRVDKLYLSVPRVNGKVADSPEIRKRLAEAQSLYGEYIVYWR